MHEVPICNVTLPVKVLSMTSKNFLRMSSGCKTRGLTIASRVWGKDYNTFEDGNSPPRREEAPSMVGKF